MSFDLICENCGAPSSPSVGICPFCKSTFVNFNKNIKESVAVTAINKLFNEGKMDQALLLANQAEKKKPEILNQPKFVILYAKILLETDGPSSKIRSLLSQCLLENPDESLLTEYLEIVNAKSNLTHDVNDLGELELTNLIRRSPKNVHALFLLGSHLFWIEKDTGRSLKYLEACHRLRPNFLRAAACLAALYKNLGLDAQASRLFRHCASIESNKNMKAYFKQLA
ncbi:MAG: hypothetical protein KDD58_01355 [Bdellovibrionales bacterium]|nr:hypothetical protein [Bdellovibrionales bacterium]